MIDGLFRKYEKNVIISFEKSLFPFAKFCVNLFIFSLFANGHHMSGIECSLFLNVNCIILEHH